MASLTTFPPVSGVNTGTAYDDTAITTRVKGLEEAGFITADDLPEISEAEWSGISGNIADQEDLATALNAKQDTLVSGQNIKTINGETVLGEGDIIIESGGLDEAQLEAFLVGLEDGTLSGDEYVVMVNREQDVVTRYSLNDLISTIASLVDTTGGDSGLDFEDRQKIDSIAFGATKNETDGYLLDRANHTGTIPMSVVANLDQTLANIKLGDMAEVNQRISELEENKQDALESGTSIKTVNGHSLLGSGNVATGLLAGNLVYRSNNNAFVDNVDNNTVRVTGLIQDGDFVLFGYLTDPTAIQLQGGNGTGAGQGSWSQEAVSVVDTRDFFSDGSSLGFWKLNGDTSDEGGSLSGVWGGVSNYTESPFSGQQAGQLNNTNVTFPLNLPPSAFTISLWFYHSQETPQGNYARIFDAWTSVNTSGVLIAYVAATRDLMVEASSTSARHSIVLESWRDINPSGWYQITLTYENSFGKVYINGKSVGGFATTSTVNNARQIRVGGSYVDLSSGWFNGAIGQIRVFNRAVSDDEAAQIYSETSFGEGIISHYLGESQSNVYLDYLETTNTGYPLFENNAAALNAGLRMGDLYYDSNYFIKVVF